MARKKKTGKVIANKMAKTVKVAVPIIMEHPIYHKKFKRSRVFLAEAKEAYEIGDLVEIEECRPISKRKRWKVIRKIKN